MPLPSLPEDIQVEIFVKLSVNSILACKCVCKLWFALLSNPNFVSNHLNLAKQRNDNLRVMLSHNDFESCSDTNPAALLRLSSIGYGSILRLSLGAGGEYEREGVVRIDYPLYPFTQEEDVRALIILGSCNGMICLGVFTGSCGLRKIYIWNPSTKEYKEIPECKFSSSSFEAKYGFGYDNNIGDYKVVCISDGENYGCLDIQVYTLGSDSWHHVLTIPCSFSSDETFYSVLFNGALHWLGVTNTSSSEVICAFNISNERLVHLLLPEKTTKGWEEEDENATKAVGMLGDCICLSFGLKFCRASIWVMQDYGVQNSWTKRFSITRMPIIPMDSYFFCKPIWTFQSGEILLDTANNLIVYDPKSKKVRIAISDAYISHREFYVESLVSVKSGTYVV